MCDESLRPPAVHRGRRRLLSALALHAAYTRATGAVASPKQRPATFDLVVNLKSAKALNVRIPDSLLTRAEQPIR